jgi:Tol biopolymer transport system component
MAREPGIAWQIYLVPADGTDLHPLKPESRKQADPAWSADGRSIAFGRVPDLMGHENAARSIHFAEQKWAIRYGAPIVKRSTLNPSILPESPS